jgi:hypothetical protein
MVDERSKNALEIGKMFKDFSNFLKMYTQYLINFDIARARRGYLLTNNRRFAEYLDKMKNDPKFNGMGIEAYLIEPVQRIPRYRLLLEQLLKYTSESHVEYEIIREALQLVSEVASRNNEAIRERENKDKMMEVMMSFESRTRRNLFDDPHRNFLKEGNLMKQCRRGLKEFRYWLFTDKLIYGEPTGLGSYRVNREILFLEMRIFTKEDNCFVIESKEKSFITYAKDDAELKEWYQAIIEAMIARQQQARSLDNENGMNDTDIAPLWTPNKEATQCQLCYTPFTIFYRRHHCRNCGKLVCDPCSSFRAMVPNIDKKNPVRVCDECTKKLLPKQELSSSRSFRISSIVGLSFAPLIRGQSRVSTDGSTLDGEISPSGSVAEAPPPPPPLGSTGTSPSMSADYASHHQTMKERASVSRRININISPGHDLYSISREALVLPVPDDDDDDSDNEIMINPEFDRSSPTPTSSEQSSPSPAKPVRLSKPSSVPSTTVPPPIPMISTARDDEDMESDIPTEETIRTVIQRKSAVFCAEDVAAAIRHVVIVDEASTSPSAAAMTSSSSSTSSGQNTRRASMPATAMPVATVKNPAFMQYRRQLDTSSSSSPIDGCNTDSLSSSSAVTVEVETSSHPTPPIKPRRSTRRHSLMSVLNRSSVTSTISIDENHISQNTDKETVRDPEAAPGTVLQALEEEEPV